MPAPLLIPAIIAGAGAIAGGIMGSAGQRSTNRTNLQIAREQRAFDLDMWNKANLYNSPYQQMQRLEDAGLNPNLIYGSGSATGGTADALRSPDMPRFQNELQQFAQSVAPAISMYQDFRLKDAQVNVQQQQAQLLQQETLNKSVDGILKRFQAAKSEAESGYYTDMAQYQAAAMNQKVLQESLRRELMTIQATREQETLSEAIEQAKWVTRDVKQRALRGELGLEFERELKPYGMTASDPLWQRKLLPVIERWLMEFISGGKKSRIYDLVR